MAQLIRSALQLPLARHLLKKRVSSRCASQVHILPVRFTHTSAAVAKQRRGHRRGYRQDPQAALPSAFDMAAQERIQAAARMEAVNAAPHLILDFIDKNSSVQYNPDVVVRVCQAFLDVGTDPDKLREELCVVPVSPLFEMQPSQLQGVLTVFADHGVPPDTILSIIVAYGGCFNVAPMTLHSNLQQIRLITIKDVSLLEYLDVCPHLLAFTPSYLVEHITKLTTVFPPKEVKHMIRNCPQLLYEPYEVTHQKVVYIYEEMGLDQPHMAYNKTLSHSLEYIMARQQALHRTGRYIKPKLFRDRLSYLINPRLEHIMDSSEQQFLSRIACLSDEEWEVLKALLQEERDHLLLEGYVPFEDVDNEEDEEGDVYDRNDASPPALNYYAWGKPTKEDIKRLPNYRNDKPLEEEYETR